MAHTKREALIAMGYREVKPGQWLKPIGYQSFGFNEKTSEWVNVFKDAQGNVSVFQSHKLNDDNSLSYVETLKKFECYTRTDIDTGFETGVPSSFELSAIDLQVIE